jgi:hypothetical protein
METEKRELRPVSAMETPNRSIIPMMDIVKENADEIIDAAWLVIIVGAVLVGSSYYLFPFVVELIRSGRQSIPFLATAAFGIGLIAWYVRDVLKSKWYPLLELAFGIAVAVQPAVQYSPSASAEVLLLAIIATFVGGVRIVTDGLKRFFEFKSYELFADGQPLHLARKTGAASSIKAALQWASKMLQPLG